MHIRSTSANHIPTSTAASPPQISHLHLRCQALVAVAFSVLGSELSGVGGTITSLSPFLRFPIGGTSRFCVVCSAATSLRRQPPPFFPSPKFPATDGLFVAAVLTHVGLV